MHRNLSSAKKTRVAKIAKPRGRPSKYKPEFARLAYKHCLLGATTEELGTFFDVSTQTITHWLNQFPDFLAAVKRGKGLADGRVASSLFHRALGYTHKSVKIFQDHGTSFEHEYIERYPPDPLSCIFWLKNRQPAKWRDRPASDAGGDRLDEVFEVLKHAVTHQEDEKNNGTA